jgi:hypothetical protein
MTWTEPTANISSFTEPGVSDPALVAYELLIDDTYELLIDDTFSLLIQADVPSTTWVQATAS